MGIYAAVVLAGALFYGVAIYGLLGAAVIVGLGLAQIGVQMRRGELKAPPPIMANEGRGRRLVQAPIRRRGRILPVRLLALRHRNDPRVGLTRHILAAAAGVGGLVILTLVLSTPHGRLLAQLPAAIVFDIALIGWSPKSAIPEILALIPWLPLLFGVLMLAAGLVAYPIPAPYVEIDMEPLPRGRPVELVLRQARAAGARRAQIMIRCLEGRAADAPEVRYEQQLCDIELGGQPGEPSVQFTLPADAPPGDGAGGTARWELEVTLLGAAGERRSLFPVRVQADGPAAR